MPSRIFHPQEGKLALVLLILCWLMVAPGVLPPDISRVQECEGPAGSQLQSWFWGRKLRLASRLRWALRPTLSSAPDLQPTSWRGGGVSQRVPTSLATTVLGEAKEGRNSVARRSSDVFAPQWPQVNRSDTRREFPELTAQSDTSLGSIAKCGANVCTCFCLE